MSQLLDQPTLDLINEMPVFKQIENIDLNIQQLLEATKKEPLESQDSEVQSLTVETLEEPLEEELPQEELPPEPSQSEILLQEILIELQTKNETDTLILQKLETLEESATVSQDTDILIYWYLIILVPLIVAYSFFRSVLSPFLR